MRKEVEETQTIKRQICICDKCKKILTGKICIICGLDICNKCGYRIDLDKALTDELPRHYSDYPERICKECWEKGKEIRTTIMSVRIQAERSESALLKKWEQLTKPSKEG